MPTPTIIAFLGQIFISLYPILIKNSQATIPQQIAGRFGIFSLLPVLVAGPGVLSLLGDVKTFAAGLVNIFHVLESYKSFQLLPAGVAYSIIYTYPFWNLLGGRLLLGEPIPAGTLPVFGLAFLGVLLLAFGSGSMNVKSQGRLEKAKEGGGGVSRVNMRGLAAAFMGAITETILYLIVRGSEFQSPMYNIGRLYLGGALLLLLGGAVLRPQVFSSLVSTPPAVPAFNALIGFTSMTALVWAAKKIPTYIYSIIAFVGLVSSYGWGVLFAEEVPSVSAVLGSLIIAASVWLLPSVTSK